MRDILLAAIVFGSIPFIFYRPYIGVLVWAWLSYMTPFRYAWSFAYDFRFVMIVGAVTLLAWVLSRENKKIPWSLPVVAMVAFWVWSSVTTFFAMFPDHAAGKWEELTKILLIDGIVTIAVFNNRFRLNALVWVIALSIGFFGFKGGIFTLTTGGIHRVGGVSGAYFSDNNLLAVALLMTVPLIRYLQLTSEQRLIRWGLGLAIVICTIGILGTHSRGGLIGLIVLMVLMLARSRQKFALAMVSGVLLLAAYSFMPQTWHDRMATIFEYEEESSAQSRIESWGYGWELALERPLTGGGFKAYRGNKSEETGVGYRSAHSIYFQVLGDHGFVGFSFFVMMVGSTIYLAISVARRAKPQSRLRWARDLMQLAQVSLIVFAVSGTFLSIAYFELLFHLVAIVVATDTIVRRELSGSTETATVPTAESPDIAQETLTYKDIRPTAVETLDS